MHSNTVLSCSRILRGLAIAAGVLLVAMPAVRAQDADRPVDVEFASFFEQGAAEEPVPAFARVRFEEGGLRLVRVDGTAEDVGFNAPVYPGDRIETAERQRAELQLPDGSLLRIDRLTWLRLASLADPATGSSAVTVIALERGSIQADVPRPAGGDAFRVDTPSASVYPLEPSAFRVDVGAHDVVKVSVEYGRVEVAGEGASRVVYGGERLRVMRGRSPGRPYAYNALIRDRFDDWVRQRDDVYRMHAARGPEYEALPEEVRPYYGELSSNGRWVYLDDLGWAWVPSVDDDDWAPYSYGYWDDGPYGPVWVPVETWGWPVYRYGRWHFSIGIGWTWIPGRIFRPAHVYWYYGPSWVGWVPIDVWGWPVYVGPRFGVVWHDPFFDPFPWVFVDYHHFWHTPVHVHRLPRHKIVPRDLRRGVIAREAVIPPRSARHTRGNARSVGVRDLDGSRIYRRASELARTRPAVARRAADLPRDVDPGELRRLRGARSVRAPEGRAGRSLGVRDDGSTARRATGRATGRDGASRAVRPDGRRRVEDGADRGSRGEPGTRARGVREIPRGQAGATRRIERRAPADAPERPRIRIRRLEDDTGSVREERNAPRNAPRVAPRSRGARENDPGAAGRAERTRTFERRRDETRPGAGSPARGTRDNSTDERVRRFFGRIGGRDGDEGSRRERALAPRREGSDRAPERVQPRRAPERVQPRRAPERVQPRRAPERVQPRRAPERVQPRRAPERVQPRRAPERVQPRRAPERVQPRRAPERVQPRRAPERVQPRRAPERRAPRVSPPSRRDPAPKARKAPSRSGSRPKVSRPSGSSRRSSASRPSRSSGGGGKGRSRGSGKRR